MVVQELYENITRLSPCSENEFYQHLDMTVRTLIAKYGTKKVLIEDKDKGDGSPVVYTKPADKHDDIPVREPYFPAVMDNILYLLTKDENRKTDFVQEAEDAYRTVWRQMYQGKKFRDWRYGTYV